MHSNTFTLKVFLNTSLPGLDLGFMPPPPKPVHLKKKNADPQKSRDEEIPAEKHKSETIIQQTSEQARKPLKPSRKPSKPREMSRPTSPNKGAPRTKAVPPPEKESSPNEEESEVEEEVFPDTDKTENEMTSDLLPPLVDKPM